MISEEEERDKVFDKGQNKVEEKCKKENDRMGKLGKVKDVRNGLEKRKENKYK